MRPESPISGGEARSSEQSPSDTLTSSLERRLVIDEIKREAIMYVYGEELLSHASWVVTSNRQALRDSHICACIHCGIYFFPEEIKEWSRNDSAICPHCGWVAILPDSAHLPLVPGYLAGVKKRWCKPT